MARQAALALAMLFAMIGVSSAQTVSATTGAINGRVTDNTGAVLPGASVVAASTALMGTREAVTNEEGNYRFPAVPPGDYTLTFELAGFSTVRREGIRVGLGFTATVNIEMRIAGLEESVTVTGESPVVDTQATKITTSFDSQMLASLPSARDQWAILAESPAVRLSRIDVGGSASGTQTGFSVYGTDGQNRPLVEGINSTEGTGAFGNYVDYGSYDEVALRSLGPGLTATTQWIGSSDSLVAHINALLFPGRGAISILRLGPAPGGQLLYPAPWYPEASVYLTGPELDSVRPHLAPDLVSHAARFAPLVGTVERVVQLY